MKGREPARIAPHFIRPVKPPIGALMGPGNPWWRRLGWPCAAILLLRARAGSSKAGGGGQGGKAAPAPAFNSPQRAACPMSRPVRAPANSRGRRTPWPDRDRSSDRRLNIGENEARRREIPRRLPRRCLHDSLVMPCAVGRGSVSGPSGMGGGMPVAPRNRGPGAAHRVEEPPVRRAAGAVVRAVRPVAREQPIQFRHFHIMEIGAGAARYIEPCRQRRSGRRPVRAGPLARRSRRNPEGNAIGREVAAKLRIGAEGVMLVIFHVEDQHVPNAAPDQRHGAEIFGSAPVPQRDGRGRRRFIGRSWSAGAALVPRPKSPRCD